MASDKPWGDFSAADYSDEQWAKACLIDTGEGEGKQRYALPVYEPGGALNRDACHAAAGRISQVDCSPEKKAAAARKLVGLYRSQLNEDPPEGLVKMAGMESVSNRESQIGPIEFRDSKIEDINFPQRVITITAVPYESPGLVEYRGQLCQEIHERGAYAGAESNPHRIRVNRGHDKQRTVGKVVSFPSSDQGLVANIRIAKTPLGDETLALADEDCLSASVGYGVLGVDGQKIDRRTHPITRRINRAWLEHIALVETPTFAEARVLAVREDGVNPDPLPPFPATPNIDQAIADMRDIMRWSSERLKRSE